MVTEMIWSLRSSVVATRSWARISWSVSMLVAALKLLPAGGGSAGVSTDGMRGRRFLVQARVGAFGGVVVDANGGSGSPCISGGRHWGLHCMSEVDGCIHCTGGGVRLPLGVQPEGWRQSV